MPLPTEDDYKLVDKNLDDARRGVLAGDAAALE
jgi:hypothetical protein